jgi:hypothetical protein
MMTIFRGEEKIGTLQDAKIRNLEIEGLWIGYFDPIDAQTEPYTLKTGNEIYEDCWLSETKGVNNGSIVKFQALRKTADEEKKKKK